MNSCLLMLKLWFKMTQALRYFIFCIHIAERLIMCLFTDTIIGAIFFSTTFHRHMAAIFRGVIKYLFIVGILLLYFVNKVN